VSVRDQVRRTVGRYEVVREVGRGATAVVFLARQTDLDREIALKELAAFRAGDPDLLERFLRESRLAGSLSRGPASVTGRPSTSTSKGPRSRYSAATARRYTGRAAREERG
jgi:serine/threonine protein kinase